MKRVLIAALLTVVLLAGSARTGAAQSSTCSQDTSGYGGLMLDRLREAASGRDYAPAGQR